MDTMDKVFCFTWTLWPIAAAEEAAGTTEELAEKILWKKKSVKKSEHDR